MKKLILILATLGLILSIASYSYAGDDNSDRLSTSQSFTFGPAYANDALRRAKDISDKSSFSSSPIENQIYNAQNKVSNQVREDAVTKVAPELKKKTGGGGVTNNTQLASAANKNIPVSEDAAKYNISIGQGTDKQYDENGRLMSEVFNGQRYVYAGFDNVGVSSIQQAIDAANTGDTVIVKSGTYDERFGAKSGVNMFGGYNADGSRDIFGNTTLINNLQLGGYDVPIEINGFTFNSGVSVGESSANITLRNNTFYGFVPPNSGNTTALYAVGANNLVLEGNTFSATCYALWICGSSITATNNNFDNGLLVVESSFISSANNYGSWNGASTNLVENSNIISTNDAYLSSGWFDMYSTYPTWANPNPPLSNISIDSPLESPNQVQNYTPTLNAYIAPVFDSSLANNAPYIYSQNNMVDNTSNPIYSDSLSGRMYTVKTDDNRLASDSKGLMGSANTKAEMLLVNQSAADALRAYALSVPIAGISDTRGRDMESSITLANILKNPTEDQRMILDAVTALLKDVSNQEQGSISPESVKKAQDDLLQMVAAVLIAQAIPDLLKEGDVTGIKNIFQDLNASKGKMLQDYNIAIKPYYDEMKKIFIRNISALQFNNILSKSVMEEELNKLEPNEVDKLLEKLRKATNRSQEEEYILQQEAKYRKEYIDPNKKILEEKMKAMMKSFTERISKALETAGAKRK